MRETELAIFKNHAPIFGLDLAFDAIDIDKHRLASAFIFHHRKLSSTNLEKSKTSLRFME